MDLRLARPLLLDLMFLKLALLSLLLALLVSTLTLLAKSRAMHALSVMSPLERAPLPALLVLLPPRRAWLSVLVGVLLVRLLARMESAFHAGPVLIPPLPQLLLALCAKLVLSLVPLLRLVRVARLVSTPQLQALLNAFLVLLDLTVVLLALLNARRALLALSVTKLVSLDVLLVKWAIIRLLSVRVSVLRACLVLSKTSRLRPDAWYALLVAIKLRRLLIIVF